MLLEALKGGYAVGAFNITNLMEMGALIEAAVRKQSPLVIQTNETVARFLGPKAIVALFRTLTETAFVPVALHLDHCVDARFAKACADAGYTSIMIDASGKPLAENVRVTREVCDYCHGPVNIPVEGELGIIAGFKDRARVVGDDAALCAPDQAVGYVTSTGVDYLAPAIGTAHGLYRSRNPKLDLDRLERINHRLSSEGLGIPLVIHGGTGIPPDTVREIVSRGVAKYNVSTDLKRALIETTYSYISEHRHEYLPERIDPEVKAAVIERVEHWMELLGCAGKAAGLREGTA